MLPVNTISKERLSTLNLETIIFKESVAQTHGDAPWLIEMRTIATSFVVGKTISSFTNAPLPNRFEGSQALKVADVRLSRTCFPDRETVRTFTLRPVTQVYSFRRLFYRLRSKVSPCTTRVMSLVPDDPFFSRSYDKRGKNNTRGEGVSDRNPLVIGRNYLYGEGFWTSRGDVLTN